MLEDREYMRESPRGFQWSATIGLLILNGVAFLLQITVLPHLIHEDHLALSLEGLRRGYVWQLFTFQLLHSGWMHLLLNCWALYVFGREVELALGKPRFLLLYFTSGVGGGLLHAFAAFVWPRYFDTLVVGASAGVFGVVSAFALLWPDRRLTLFLFYVIPVNLQARTLLIAELVMTGLGIAFPTSQLIMAIFGNTAHVAHLGGILAGLAFVRWSEKLSGAFRSEPEAARPSVPFRFFGGKRAKSEPPAEPAAGEFISREVDPILDKISAHGIQSLTPREREILDAARQKMTRP